MGEGGEREPAALAADPSRPADQQHGGVGGFAHSEPGLPAPDLQLHVLPVPYQNQGLDDPAKRAMTVLVGLVDVASRGRVKLHTSPHRTGWRLTRATCPTNGTAGRWPPG